MATLLPNIKDLDQGAEVFRIMSKTLHDDKAAFEFLCPQQVRQLLVIACAGYPAAARTLVH